MTITERQDAPAEGVLDSGRPGALHRLTGAAPVCAVLLLVAVVVALLTPSVRHTVSLSFQRQPERYVELYFTNPTQAASCATIDGRLTVRATVRSHLAGAQDLRYTVGLTSGGRVATSMVGVVQTAAGRTTDFGATLTVPAGDYGVAVALVGRSERLALHCAAGG